MLTNSAVVFTAFSLFMLFGYLSVLRTIARFYFPAKGFIASFTSAFKDSRVLAHFGSSAIFMCIPATSLLLFWGIAPALLWLLVAHLLIDSITHLQISAAEQIQRDPKHKVKLVSKIARTIHDTLKIILLAALAAISVSLLAYLIDRQSGLVFALLLLLPAHQVLSQGAITAPRATLAGLFMLFGILCAHQLGFSIYGEWQAPEMLARNGLAWLVLNNQTIVALGLLIAALQMSKNKLFEYRFATFTGSLLLFATLFLLIKLLLLQASLDAPLNVTSSTAVSEAANAALTPAADVNAPDALASEPLKGTDNPPFSLISLVLFASLISLLFRVSRASLYDKANDDIASRFGRLQWESLLQLLFILVLTLSLASATGIGAWSTHYTADPFEQNLVTHFNLALSSVSALLDPSERTGTLTNTVLLVGMVFAGFSFLVSVVSRLNSAIDLFSAAQSNTQPQATSAQNADTQKVAKLTESIPAALVFFAACFLIEHGINMTVWVFLGCLAWTVFSYHALGACASVQTLGRGSANTAFANYIVVITAVLGFVHCMYFVLWWYFEESMLAAVALQILIILGVSSWWDKLLSVVAGLKPRSEQINLGD